MANFQVVIQQKNDLALAKINFDLYKVREIDVYLPYIQNAYRNIENIQWNKLILV